MYVCVCVCVCYVMLCYVDPLLVTTQPGCLELSKETTGKRQLPW